MSVCINDEWSEAHCPCLCIARDTPDAYCSMRVFRINEELPDTCLYAPILKVLVEADEVGDYKFMPHDPRDPDDWDLFEFWIRRKP